MKSHLCQLTTIGLAEEVDEESSGCIKVNTLWILPLKVS